MSELTDSHASTGTPSQQERVLRHFKNSTHKQKVCIIDGDSTWLESWPRTFARLSIQHLRSPALAHPDPHALLSYAIRNNWEDELLESGCFDINSLLALGQS
jgi:hypothetical protein